MSLHATSSQTVLPSPRRRGVALLLVLAALVITTVLAMSFLAAQSTSTAVGRNVVHHAAARAIAESALDLALAEVRGNPDWRSRYDSGLWVSEQALAGGVFSLRGEDEDGDLTDDLEDPVLLVATGRFQGASHTVRAQVTPRNTQAPAATVLLIVGNAAQLTADEANRRALLMSWNWTVRLQSASGSQQQYNAALAQVNVVYLPHANATAAAATQLYYATQGVVYDGGDMTAPLNVASTDASFTSDRFRLTDTSHYITEPFATGDLVVAAGTASMAHPNGELAPGARALGRRPRSPQNVLVAVDRGGELRGGGLAQGRRVASPLGQHAVANLTDQGKTLLKRMLEWAGDTTASEPPATGTSTSTFTVRWLEQTP